MFSEDKVTEIFCLADEFCKFFDAQQEKSMPPYNCLFTTKNRTCIICISYTATFNILVKSHIASFVLRRKYHPLIYLFLTFCKHNMATNTHFSRKAHEKATFFQFAAATN